MKFELIKFTNLDRTKYSEASVWGQYYEPSDVDSLESLGFDRSLVVRALESVSWSDEYWFPLPTNTELGTFMFEHRYAQFRTGSGKELSGFVVNSGHCVCLFGSNNEWDININLLDLVYDEIQDLKKDIGLNEDDSLFPIEVVVPDINFKFTVDGRG